MRYQRVTILSMFSSEAFYLSLMHLQRRQLFLRKLHIYCYIKNFGDNADA